MPLKRKKQNEKAANGSDDEMKSRWEMLNRFNKFTREVLPFLLLTLVNTKKNENRRIFQSVIDTFYAQQFPMMLAGVSLQLTRSLTFKATENRNVGFLVEGKIKNENESIQKIFSCDLQSSEERRKMKIFWEKFFQSIFFFIKLMVK